VQFVILFILAFRSPAHATISRKGRDIDIDAAASHRGSFDPHACIDAMGIPRGCQMNLKSETILKQDLNQYSSGGPLQIKMSIELIIFIITNKGLLTIPEMPSKE
jgi:hypothetical protein